MSPVPLPIRVAAGLVATALEQVRKFPEQLSDLPVTAASRAVQAGMRMQQRVTELAIKGDQVFALFQPVEDTPPWARFDEDDTTGETGEAPAETRPEASANGAEPPGEIDRNEIDRGEIDEATVARAMAPTHRTATSDDQPDNDQPDNDQPDDGGSGRGSGTPPALPGYDELTLAQLRGRLRGLSLPQLEALLEHEQNQCDRAAFVTMLSNRIITVRSR